MFVTSSSGVTAVSDRPTYDLEWIDEGADVLVRGSSDLDVKRDLLAFRYGSREPIPLRWRWGKDVVQEGWTMSLRPGRKGLTPQSLFLNPLPSQYAKKMNDSRMVVVTLGDLSSGKIVWKQWWKASVFELSSSWSPDGKILALMETRRPKKDGAGDTRGIELLDGSTGKRMASLTLDHVDFCLGIREFRWMTNSVLLIKEDDGKMRQHLNFYNVRTGKRIGSWPAAAFIGSIEAMSVDAKGNTWAFANYYEGWRVYTRAQIQGLELRGAAKGRDLLLGACHAPLQVTADLWGFCNSQMK
jgi:hypothetical protein